MMYTLNMDIISPTDFLMAQYGVLKNVWDLSPIFWCRLSDSQVVDRRVRRRVVATRRRPSREPRAAHRTKRHGTRSHIDSTSFEET